MKCPFCGKEFEVTALKNYNEILESTPDNISWNDPSQNTWTADEAERLIIYTCNSCGGEIITEKTTSATVCPFCDNPTIIPRQISGDLKPDVVIPFRLDKSVAKASLIHHFEGKRLLPKVFRQENHIDEIQGVYVPFWLFDADADALTAYNAAQQTSWSDGRNHYTETSHFSATRKGKLHFEHIPVDGSMKMPDDLMDSLEPFDFSQAVPFSPAYLSGYVADRYDVDIDHSIQRVNARIKSGVENAMMQTVERYNGGVQLIHSSIQLENGRALYALYPVWILRTTWRDKKYLFAMNGQTGKLVGDLPLDKGSYIRHLMLISASVSAALFAVIALIWFLL